MKKPTIKDIAQLAGVSDTTVSNVINNKKGRVSMATRLKIEKAIKNLNYKTNYAAKSLAHKKSNLIGIIIPQTEKSSRITLENSFYGEIISRIEYKMRQKGYYTILSGIQEEEKDADFLIKWNLDAAIVFGIYEEKFYHNIKKQNIPIILVDSYINDDYFLQINTNDKKGGYIAGQYLIDKGHKNIAIITGQKKQNGVMAQRYSGLEQALQENNLVIKKTYSGHVSHEWGEQVAKLLNPAEISAVFSTADIISLGLMSGLNKRKIRIPDDISIISFDNTYLSHICIPNLTAVDQDILLKSETIVDHIFNNLEVKTAFALKSVNLDVKIVERDSVTQV